VEAERQRAHETQLQAAKMSHESWEKSRDRDYDSLEKRKDREFKEKIVDKVNQQGRPPVINVTV